MLLHKLIPKRINNKEKIETSIFIISAILQLAIPDIVLKYIENPIKMSGILYIFLPIFFSILWISTFFLVCAFILPKKVGRMIYTLVTLIFTVWFCGNYLSFKVLGGFLHIKSIFLAGEASKYFTTVIPYIDMVIIISTILIFICIIFSCVFWKTPVLKNKKMKYILTGVSILGLIIIEIIMNYSAKKELSNGAWEVWDKPTLVYEKFTDANKLINIVGIHQYTIKDICKTIFADKNYSKIEDMQVAEYINNNRDESTSNEMTGVLKDKNVIIVLMESMDDITISQKYTPTIKYMMDNGINFTNHYMPNIGTGYTFNSEFTVNTGYICPSSETSASIYTSNDFRGSIGKLLGEQGYISNIFHFNSKDFYNRLSMYKQFGYSDYKCLMNYLPIEKCVQDSEAVKSDKVYDLMTPEGKFLDFFITYSAHLPYDEENNKLKGARENYPDYIDESLDEELKNLYLLSHDTDEFFRILLERLQSDNLLNDTVIIGITDHYAYGLTDKEQLKDLSIKAGSDILEKTPFFIYSPGLTPTKVTKVTAAKDILPTLVNMMGLDKTNFYIGSDAFDESYDGLVYFSNGDWYDGNLHFSGQEGKDKEEQEYIDNINKEIQKKIYANDYIITSDYFKRNK